MTVLDPNWVMVGLSAAGLLGAAALTMRGVGQHEQRLKDLEKARNEDRDLYKQQNEEMKVRVSKAEEGAAAVQGLAAAVEHLGERFGDQVRHLVETFGLKFDHLTAEMTDLKTEVRKRRAPQTARRVK